jgi:hypothetical protein
MIHFVLALILPIVAAKVASLLSWLAVKRYRRWQKDRRQHRKIKSDVAVPGPKMAKPESPRRASAPDVAGGGRIFESVGADSPGTPPVAARTRHRKQLCGAEPL